MALGSKLREHLKEDLNEIRIDDGEVSLAVVKGERGEPFEDGGSGVRVRVGVCGLGMVEGDVGGERVDELVVSHESEVEKGFVWEILVFFFSAFCLRGYRYDHGMDGL